MFKYDSYRGRCLPSNWTIANVVLHGLDQTFKGQTYQVAILYLEALVDPVVIHSAASAKGPWFNFPVARVYLRFNYRASTLADRQCLAMRCMVATNCDRVMQCSYDLWFGT